MRVTYLIQAYDATHRPINVIPGGAPGEPVDLDTDLKPMLEFLHAHTSGVNDDGRARRVAYWQVGIAGSTAPGRIYVTQYGRSCANAIARIPYRYLKDHRPPEALPARPGQRPRCPAGCACDKHYRDGRDHRPHQAA
jgi:hypothetical protein